VLGQQRRVEERDKAANPGGVDALGRNDDALEGRCGAPVVVSSV
jgi:hypothetical protein